jgi:regulator of protease activity HflC (stomatin/prohibitin superfamily)
MVAHLSASAGSPQTDGAEVAASSGSTSVGAEASASPDRRDYAGLVIPVAGGDAERIVQGAKGYRQQTVADAAGQTMRFGNVLDEYKKAPDVTRARLYLEAMERVLSNVDKIIIDSNIVCRLFH